MQKFHNNMKRMTGTLHEDEYMCFITSRSVLLRMHVLDKFVEKIKTQIFFVQYFFR